MNEVKECKTRVAAITLDKTIFLSQLRHDSCGLQQPLHKQEAV